MTLRERGPWLGLVGLALLVALAYGLGSALFSSVSPQMAVTLGLSADELSLLNIGFTGAQLVGLLLAPLLVRRQGANDALRTGTLLGLAGSLLLLWSVSPFGASVAWALLGLGGSTVLVALNLILLARFSYRAMTLVLAATLVFTTYLPMGFYPWLLAEMADHLDWQLAALVMAAGYALVLTLLTHLSVPETVPQPASKSPPWFYLLAGTTLVMLTAALMRGGHYNWFDHPGFRVLAGATALLCVSVLMLFLGRGWPSRARQVLAELKTSVYLYNAFLAGFAVMASGALVGGFLGQVMGYNGINIGWVQLPALAAMLAGMAVSVLGANQSRVPSDAIVPVGVVMILISMAQLSGLPNHVAPEHLVGPLALRGFGVGLLNASVTLAVMAHFAPDERPEGVALFYLFRTLGSVIGGAVFGRVIQVGSASAMTELARPLADGNTATIAFEQAMSAALHSQGIVPNSALLASQLSATLKLEVGSLALSNALLAFLVAIGMLAPVLLAGKAMVARKQAALSAGKAA
ncbi:MFS transporter [Ferrimonas balearica]|uniref:MFS transporter n=1 Tax=Ferrimonas balearica TaxID=44012 RepID=UPI001C979F88|nr:MFS transporter [Ferrimonas balearica]MBY5979070.1 MFS transporter [Ferrimonas balearica]